MKFLTVMFDNLLNREYKLYTVNSKEIYKRLMDSYKLSNLQLQLFNSDLNLYEKINDVRYEKNIYGTIKNDGAVSRLKKTISDIHENKYVDEHGKISAKFGYELMPIVISVENDFENPEEKIELIDGFKRMFCSGELPDTDILVKVYNKLDDREWINLMVIYNSWKFTNMEKSERYMDRGFQLGLYYRYGIKFINMELIYHDIFLLINKYVHKVSAHNYLSTFNRDNVNDVYSTFWNNSEFHNDLIAMYEMFNHYPVFRVEKRGGKVEEFDLTNKLKRKKRNIRDGVCRLYEVFIYCLGDIRRYEFYHNIIERKPFDINIFYDYLKKPELQKHFLKITNMEVDGFICNYINQNLLDNINEYMYNSMGYKYDK